MPDSVPLEVYRLPDQAAAIDAFRQLRSVPALEPVERRTARADRGTAPRRRARRAPRGHPAARSGPGCRSRCRRVGISSGTRRRPTRPRPILQVTDVAGYLMVSETQTLVWANDLASGEPDRRRRVAAEGASMGRPTRMARSMADTPPALLPTRARRGRRCEPVVTVDAGGRSALPAGDRRQQAWMAGRRLDLWFIRTRPEFWRVFHTDRDRYRSDRHGQRLGRCCAIARSGNVPDSVTLRLIASRRRVRRRNRPSTGRGGTRPTGAFTGSPGPAMTSRRASTSPAHRRRRRSSRRSTSRSAGSSSPPIAWRS